MQAPDKGQQLALAANRDIAPIAEIPVTSAKQALRTFNILQKGTEGCV
jgi:hypothetical protein